MYKGALYATTESQAGSEAFQACEEMLDVHMHINTNLGSFPVKDEENATTKAGGSYNGPGHSVDGIGGHFTGDDPALRYMAIRTRFGDDFFVDCSRPSRNIKQVNRRNGHVGVCDSEWTSISPYSVPYNLIMVLLVLFITL